MGVSRILIEDATGSKEVGLSMISAREDVVLLGQVGEVLIQSVVLLLACLFFSDVRTAMSIFCCLLLVVRAVKTKTPTLSNLDAKHNHTSRTQEAKENNQGCESTSKCDDGTFLACGGSRLRKVLFVITLGRHQRLAVVDGRSHCLSILLSDETNDC